MAEEIALFIDFENIRYSLLNTQHREPDPQELINVARRYGTVMVAKAYADWSRQPEMFKGSLTAAMIDRVDCPAKQRDRYRSPTWQPGMNGHNAWNAPGESSVGTSYGSMPALGSGADDGDPDSEATRELSQVRLATPEPTPEPIALPSAAPTFNSAGSNPQTQYGTQSTVDLNMLMDIIETVFDRPSISTFVLMTGDRDFTRICARLKLRLNKFVVVAGVPGTVSRDLTAAANQFILLGSHNSYVPHANPSIPNHMALPTTGMEPADPQFLQFLDYIDRHWAWRTIIGVSNFIGDPYNHKNRFRGRLTRESARDLLQTCVQQGILLLQTDQDGNEDLRLNRSNPVVESALAASAQQQASLSASSPGFTGNWNQSQPAYSAAGQYPPAGQYPRRTTSIMSNLIDGTSPADVANDDLVDDDEDDGDIEE
jgi:hypothetical protein